MYYNLHIIFEQVKCVQIHRICFSRNMIQPTVAIGGFVLLLIFYIYLCIEFALTTKEYSRVISGK